MNQNELIKALVKVLREDIKKTLKSEIRAAVTEVLNEELQIPSVEPKKQKVSMMDENIVSSKTINFGNVNAAAGVSGLRNRMAEQMGYGDFEQQRTGLGVQTGNTALDNALNRDYTDLVKKFKN